MRDQTQTDRFETVFFDDFTAGSLDRDKWNVEGPDFWVNREEQAYIDSPDTLRFLPAGAVEGAEGGVLELRALHRPGFQAPGGRKADFVSGRIDSRGKFEFAHGRAEARIRMPAAEGVWPAFWLLGDGPWPDIGEIDVMEYVGEADWTAAAIHGPGYSGDTPLMNKYFFQPESDATDWHVYAVDWTAERMIFTIDDRLIYRATRPMVELYGEWRFDTAKFLTLNLAIGGEFPYKINRVKQPYYGLPEATAERIRQEGVGVQIDWVKVSQRAG